VKLESKAIKVPSGNFTSEVEAIQTCCDCEDLFYWELSSGDHNGVRSNRFRLSPSYRGLHFLTRQPQRSPVERERDGGFASVRHSTILPLLLLLLL